MTIGEFSVITGISAYTLRYYEKKGLLRVSRDSVGRRQDDGADGSADTAQKICSGGAKEMG